MGKRQAIVKLSRQELEQLLDLPPGLRVVTTRDDWAFSGVQVLIEGEGLEEVDERVMPPTLSGHWERMPGRARLRWVPPLGDTGV